MPGEAGFKQYCAVCHPDGGNIMNPQKTLHKKDLDANTVRKAEDIIKLIRKPGPGMTPFDANTVSDKEATEIANYILKIFKYEGVFVVGADFCLP
jgi:cytochrome c6